MLFCFGFALDNFVFQYSIPNMVLLLKNCILSAFVVWNHGMVSMNSLPFGQRIKQNNNPYRKIKGGQDKRILSMNYLQAILTSLFTNRGTLLQELFTRKISQQRWLRVKFIFFVAEISLEFHILANSSL